MPKVSVLLTTYNRPQMLEKAVNSVLNQTFQDFELIILDDNSDDPEQVKLLNPKTSPWFRANILIYHSNIKQEDRKRTTRYATMVNHGLELAWGEYVAYLCDDDYFEPNKLELCVGYLDSHPEVSVVYGRQRIVQIENEKEVPFPTPERFAAKILDQANCNVDHSSVVMRKKIYDELGGWDDDPGWWGSADGIYWEKLNKSGYLFYPIDAVLDTHVYHDGSWTKDGRWKTL